MEDFNKCVNYYCYDKDILSPAEGKVIEIVNNANDSLIFPNQLQTGQSFYNSAGIPIYFKNINLSQVANYQEFDPRPHMTFGQVLDGYISRGFAIENKQ